MTPQWLLAAGAQHVVGGNHTSEKGRIHHDLTPRRRGVASRNL